ncbi:MAG: hypothetical protein AAF502_16690 [Bacteroidota bacterium]
MADKIKLLAGVITGIAFCLTVFLLIESFKGLPSIETEYLMTNEAVAETVNLETPKADIKRKSITFILGDDQKPENRYYWEATNYYKTSPEAKTDKLVTHCRSLLEVRNYLEEKAIPGTPWGLVNLVVHSNEWSGIEIPVVPEGNRATVQTVQAALDGGLFPPLTEEIADSNTTIFMHGCALGKNEALVQVLKEAFFGKGNHVNKTLQSSPYFVLYESKMINGMPVSRKFNANAYYAFYKRGYRPGDIKLSRQLASRYAETEVDWRGALERTQPRFTGDLYHYTFHLPIVWTVTYPDNTSRPSLKTEVEKEAWLNEQPELLEAVKELGISKDLFTWTFRNVNYTFEDGVTEPGIKVIGFCTVLCVLEPLVEEKDESVMVPYSFSKQG